MRQERAWAPIMLLTLASGCRQEGPAVVDLELGPSVSMLLTADGRAFGFGESRELGLGDTGERRLQVGTRDRFYRPFPVPIERAAFDRARAARVPSQDPAELARRGPHPRSSHRCALGPGGTVHCLGSNQHGQLGLAPRKPYDESATPLQVAGLAGVTQLVDGGAFSCALGGDGLVRCWGYDFEGQVGDGGSGSAHITPTPTVVAGLTDVVELSSDAGGYHTCARRSDATAWCWGRNDHGQLGNGQKGFVTDGVRPVQVKGLRDVRRVAVGFDHGCALVGRGDVVCWGNDFVGQLGDDNAGFFAASTAPSRVVWR